MDLMIERFWGKVENHGTFFLGHLVPMQLSGTAHWLSSTFSVSESEFAP